MTSIDPPRFRDPRNPGAPIIPRSDWDFPPYHRWTFQHIREMTPTAQIWRGEGPVMPIKSQSVDLKAVTYEHAGATSTFERYLADTFVDGFLVLHKGAVVSETYLNGMKPHGTHLAMSVTKTIVGLVVGILVERGMLDVAAPLTRYLPELEATAYKGATLQHVLDMTTGVTFDESYMTPGSHMQKLDLACGWKPNTEPGWPRTMWDLVLTLTEQERPHGATFAYRSIETDILAHIMQRVTGKMLADLVSEHLWVPLGAEEDGYFTVDRGGYALADGGFNATLRDYGRFAQMITDGGVFNGRRIVPAAWIEATRTGGNHALFGAD